MSLSVTFLFFITFLFLFKTLGTLPAWIALCGVGFFILFDTLHLHHSTSWTWSVVLFCFSAVHWCLTSLCHIQTINCTWMPDIFLPSSLAQSSFSHSFFSKQLCTWRGHIVSTILPSGACCVCEANILKLKCQNFIFHMIHLKKNKLKKS